MARLMINIAAAEDNILPLSGMLFNAIMKPRRRPPIAESPLAISSAFIVAKSFIDNAKTPMAKLIRSIAAAEDNIFPLSGMLFTASIKAPSSAAIAAKPFPIPSHSKEESFCIAEERTFTATAIRTRDKAPFGLLPSEILENKANAPISSPKAAPIIRTEDISLSAGIVDNAIKEPAKIPTAKAIATKEPAFIDSVKDDSVSFNSSNTPKMVSFIPPPFLSSKKPLMMPTIFRIAPPNRVK